MTKEDIDIWDQAVKEAHQCAINQLSAIRASRAWVQWDGTRWLAMRIGKLAITGAGATVEEAIEALRAQEVQE